MPVLPMYIAGRLRTASRPSRTLISSAPYLAAACAVMPSLYQCVYGGPSDVSYSHRHDHTQESLLRWLTNETRAQRVLEFHDHLRRLHGAKHVQQIPRVEPSGQRLPLVGDHQVLFGLAEVRVAR